MKYKILQEPKITGNAFEVKTQGEDGVELVHTFTFSELELDHDNKPKWLAYIDQYYFGKVIVEGQYDFSEMKKFKGMDRDVLKDHFEKDGKKYEMDHAKILDVVKKVKATETLADDLDLLEDLRYVGPEMAKELINVFGDLNGVLMATRKELIAVDGIGEKNVDKIMKQLEELV
jgi:hypothetical protein